MRDAPQWFDPAVVPPRDDYVLVDGGAFDGDTTASFMAAFGGRFGGVYAFEPDPDLASRAAARVVADPRVHVFPEGLSDRGSWAAFLATGGTDGRIVEADRSVGYEQRGCLESRPWSDDVSVRVASIDERIREPVSLIKLDVEGAELAALRGAVGHIRSDAPLLAVATYHRASDMCAIPQYIVAQRGTYRLFLRHYTEVSFETVLYAVP